MVCVRDACTWLLCLLQCTPIAWTLETPWEPPHIQRPSGIRIDMNAPGGSPSAVFTILVLASPRAPAGQNMYIHIFLFLNCRASSGTPTTLSYHHTRPPLCCSISATDANKNKVGKIALFVGALNKEGGDSDRTQVVLRFACTGDDLVLCPRCVFITAWVCWLAVYTLIVWNLEKSKKQNAGGASLYRV